MSQDDIYSKFAKTVFPGGLTDNAELSPWATMVPWSENRSPPPLGDSAAADSVAYSAADPDNMLEGPDYAALEKRVINTLQVGMNRIEAEMMYKVDPIITPPARITYRGYQEPVKAPSPLPDVLSLHVDYLGKLFRGPEVIIRQFEELIKAHGVEVDTLVGRGVSGALSASLLARATNRNLVIVRKGGEQTHSDREIEGNLGRRWLFIDDLIASGDTLRATQKAIAHAANIHGWDTQFLGAYLYLGNILQLV